MKPVKPDYRVRPILPLVLNKMRIWDIPHKHVRSPQFVRAHPHGVFDSINICEMPETGRVDVYFEQCHVEPVWIKDMEQLDVYLSEWDKRFTAFLYRAHEYYEPRAEAFPNVLEAMASWMGTDQVCLLLYRSHYSDGEFKQFAMWEIAKRLERRHNPGIYDVLRWGK